MATNKNELRRQWPSGELTEEVIRKDTQGGTLVSAIVFTLALVAICFVLAPLVTENTTVDLRMAALLVCGVILLWQACKSWKAVLVKTQFDIREDRLVSKRVETDARNDEARKSEMSTRTPIFEFEKHGPYRVDASHIHEYYIPLELVHDFEEDEEVYMVYDKKTNKLLHIYRKKYWTMEAKQAE